MSNERQEQIFWSAIELLNNVGIIKHVMVIGSWAEYLYTNIFTEEYIPNIHTKDIDLFYRDINKPQMKIDFISLMRENGFTYDELPDTGIAKFYKEGLIELEFLSQVKGSGINTVNKINSLGIKSEGLRDINILNNYPYNIVVRGINITVPEPSAYIIQKILSNPSRVPAYKKQKDILTVKELLPHVLSNKMHAARFNKILFELTKKQLNIFKIVCEENYINITGKLG